jgi:hypothetical protein
MIVHGRSIEVMFLVLDFNVLFWFGFQCSIVVNIIVVLCLLNHTCCWQAFDSLSIAFITIVNVRIIDGEVI